MHSKFKRALIHHDSSVLTIVHSTCEAGKSLHVCMAGMMIDDLDMTRVGRRRARPRVGHFLLRTFESFRILWSF